MKFIFLGQVLGIVLGIAYFTYVSPFEDANAIDLDPGVDPVPAQVDAGQ